MAFIAIADRRIYAPFTQLVLQPVDADEKFSTSFLEQGSSLRITKEITVGPDHDKRYVASEIEIEALDPDADFTNDLTWLTLVNKQCYVYFYCFGGGGFMDGPFRYRILPDYLEGRGMRYKHVLVGTTRWIPWLTFEDGTGNWQQFLNEAGLSE
jgi:hypothetical protein